MPADATWIDDVYFSPPWEIRRRSYADAGISRCQVFGLDLTPIDVEIVNLENDHLIFLPLGNVDILEQKIRASEAQTGKAVMPPKLLETQFGKEVERGSEIRPRWNERVKRGGLWFHIALQEPYKPEERGLIDRAASALGKNRTDFVLDAARRAAEETLLERTILSVSEEAFAEFLARLDAPPKPNDRLRKTMQTPAPWEHP